MQYWLVKQEPEAYSWDNFVKDGRTAWTGVRNFQARNNLRAMKKGDQAFFYHSSTKIPAIVGLMEIVRGAYPDPTAKEPGWDQVDVQFVKTFPKPLTLDELKSRPELRSMVLVKNSRLSVQPITPGQWRFLLKLLDK